MSPLIMTYRALCITWRWWSHQNWLRISVFTWRSFYLLFLCPKQFGGAPRGLRVIIKTNKLAGNHKAPHRTHRLFHVFTSQRVAVSRRSARSGRIGRIHTEFVGLSEPLIWWISTFQNLLISLMTVCLISDRTLFDSLRSDNSHHIKLKLAVLWVESGRFLLSADIASVYRGSQLRVAVWHHFLFVLLGDVTQWHNVLMLGFRKNDIFWVKEAVWVPAGSVSDSCWKDVFGFCCQRAAADGGSKVGSECWVLTVSLHLCLETFCSLQNHIINILFGHLG